MTGLSVFATLRETSSFLSARNGRQESRKWLILTHRRKIWW